MQAGQNSFSSVAEKLAPHALQVRISRAIEFPEVLRLGFMHNLSFANSKARQSC
jgi:hypothetical protein